MPDPRLIMDEDTAIDDVASLGTDAWAPVARRLDAGPYSDGRVNLGALFDQMALRAGEVIVASGNHTLAIGDNGKMIVFTGTGQSLIVPANATANFAAEDGFRVLVTGSSAVIISPTSPAAVDNTIVSPEPAWPALLRLKSTDVWTMTPPTKSLAEQVAIETGIDADGEYVITLVVSESGTAFALDGEPATEPNVATTYDVIAGLADGLQGAGDALRRWMAGWNDLSAPAGVLAYPWPAPTDATTWNRTRNSRVTIPAATSTLSIEIDALTEAFNAAIAAQDERETLIFRLANTEVGAVDCDLVIPSTPLSTRMPGEWADTPPTVTAGAVGTLTAEISENFAYLTYSERAIADPFVVDAGIFASGSAKVVLGNSTDKALLPGDVVVVFARKGSVAAIPTAPVSPVYTQPAALSMIAGSGSTEVGFRGIHITLTAGMIVAGQFDTGVIGGAARVMACAVRGAAVSGVAGAQATATTARNFVALTGIPVRLVIGVSDAIASQDVAIPAGATEIAFYPSGGTNKNFRLWSISGNDPHDPADGAAGTSSTFTNAAIGFS